MASSLCAMLVLTALHPTSVEWIPLHARKGPNASHLSSSGQADASVVVLMKGSFHSESMRSILMQKTFDLPVAAVPAIAHASIRFAWRGAGLRLFTHFSIKFTFCFLFSPRQPVCDVILPFDCLLLLSFRQSSLHNILTSSSHSASSAQQTSPATMAAPIFDLYEVSSNYSGQVTSI